MKDDDNRSILYDWPAFLIGGMNSTNDEARCVQGYLLKMERLARVGIVSVKSVPIAGKYPEPVHAMVMAKLSKEAWRGNPLAAWILENHYQVPVQLLMRRIDPELSETAGTIAQYLQLVCHDNPVAYGLETVSGDGIRSLTGETTNFYRAFLDAGRRHHLPQFFTSPVSLGAILAREADALESLGWRRSLAKNARGRRFFRYEYQKPPVTVTVQ